MTQEEFLSRVKSEALKNVDANFYSKVIESIYYMTDADKDEFCATFNKVFGKLINDDDTKEFLKQLAWFYRSSEEYDKKVQRERVQAKEERERLENLLIQQGLENEVKISKAELIRRKVKMGLPLTDDQATYICNNLH